MMRVDLPIVKGLAPTVIFNILSLRCIPLPRISLLFSERLQIMSPLTEQFRQL
jgi:hypothetical protein